MKFCDNCGSRLNIRFAGENISFICARCLTTAPAEPIDTVLYDQANTSGLANILPYVNHAEKDISNARVYRDCSKCKGKIMQLLIIGPNCVRVFVCINSDCNYKEYT